MIGNKNILFCCTVTFLGVSIERRLDFEVLKGVAYVHRDLACRRINRDRALRVTLLSVLAVCIARSTRKYLRKR